MADYDLVRDILDEQLVDERGRRLGKADDIVIELRDDAPPRLVAIEIGLPVLGHRLHPAAGRWLERFNRWVGIANGGCTRFTLDGMEVRETEIRLAADAEASGALAWEDWLRGRVVDRLPAGSAAEAGDSSKARN